MPEIEQLKADATHLYATLREISDDFEGASLGSLRTAIERARREAEAVLDAIADVGAANPRGGSDDVAK